LKIVAPTIDFQAGHLAILPVLSLDHKQFTDIPQKLIQYARDDWNSYETSWNFTDLPLLRPEYRRETLAETYKALRAKWQQNTDDMQRLEEENNRMFINAYGLEDELSPQVPLNEITLTCNPHYRYGGSANKTQDELDSLLKADTVKELISYAIGCMFGRYSLDKPGLIMAGLAGAGERIGDYLKQVPEPTFMPDDDNVIPILDKAYFVDDAADRFGTFVATALGYDRNSGSEKTRHRINMEFIESALGMSVRRYLLKDFYDDHVKRYKKRPIYWLFTSPKGSFNALIYMHRYHQDMASVVLNKYLREFMSKLNAEKNSLDASSTKSAGAQADKTRALKELENIKKIIAELEVDERDVVYPLAISRISLDLDDGVRANYPKLGPALRKIAGLEQGGE
jgi:type II restriction/modification system DNA methylase subunit YeeA